VRTNGLPDTAKKWAAAQSPEFAPLIAAFVKGLNAWADEHRAEISAEAAGVLPITAEDVYAHGLRVIHYDWIVSPARLERRLARWEQDVHGSNEWAIAPARSATGKALLMSNSHLQWGDIHTYFEVQLTAPESRLRRCVGRLPGAAPVLHRVRRLDADHEQPLGIGLYKLVLKDGGYVLDGQVKPFDTHTETIKVRQAEGTTKDEILTVRRTEHGPVVAERDGAPIAMRVAALDRPKMFEQFWRMAWRRTSRSGKRRCACSSCRSSIRPTLTATAASPTSTTRRCGSTPPATTAFWQGVVPGDRSDLIGTEIVPYDEIPKVIDPPQADPELERHAVDVDVSGHAGFDQVRRRLRRAAGHHTTRSARHAHPEHSAREDHVRGRQVVEVVDTRRNGPTSSSTTSSPRRRRGAPPAPNGLPTCWRSGTGRAKWTATGCCSSSSS